MSPARFVRNRLAGFAILALIGCAASPIAIQALDTMKDQAARSDWAALAASRVSDCAAGDRVCAQRQALRSQGCRRQAAAGDLSETARRNFLDCAVSAGRAGRDAAPEDISAREAYAAALFARRQARPGSEVCADNTPLLAEADALRTLRPAEPGPRFLAASARLTAIARACTADPPCPPLAAARALLADPPANAASEWQALAGGIALTARRFSCPI